MTEKTKAPERTWARVSENPSAELITSLSQFHGAVEYVRADLSPALGAAAMRTAAAKVANPEPPQDVFMYLHEEVLRCKIAAAVRALPPPDHAALLAEAMRLPEIAALVEALDGILDAITAEDRFMDRALTITGPTAALKWLIETEDAARAALAAVPGVEK